MIKIGDVLFLEPNHLDKPEKYKCKVAEMTNGTIYIDYPINLKTNKTVFLMEGMEFKATFVTEEGTVFLFECEVLRRIKLNIPMIAISYPGSEQLVKIQRRQFVRIDTTVDAAVHPVDSDLAPFIAVTSDISAGGAAILIDKRMNVIPNTELKIWFVLSMQNGAIHYLKLKGRVVRIKEENETHSIMSIQFIDTSPFDRQILLRFCFDQQLSLKKKGLETKV